jgi:hypothetical protein
MNLRELACVAQIVSALTVVTAVVFGSIQLLQARSSAAAWPRWSPR